MTVLVTGGNGQLGCSLRLAAAKSRHHFIFTDVEELDITSAEALAALFEREVVDVVVNCAAYTAVDRAEEDEEQAEAINHRAVSLLAEACKRYDATLIHISTDYVFSGEGDMPYREDATPSPINAYGRTKLSGERAVVESGCKSIILRTSWLYSEFGRNFCKSMRELTATRSEVRVVADQVGTPTYAGDLAATITYIIDSEQIDKCGTYHYSNEGQCSWYEFASEIARLSGNSGCEVIPCTTEEFPTKAQRPRYSVLDKSRVVATFGIIIPDWRTSLKECIAKM